MSVAAPDGVCRTYETRSQFSAHARERLQVNSCYGAFGVQTTPSALKFRDRLRHALGDHVMSAARRKRALKSQLMGKRAHPHGAV